MILAHTISVEGKSRQNAEKLMGESFNDWAKNNLDCTIFHLFEPVRHNEIFGDYNYNRYYSEFTFFYVVADDSTRDPGSNEPATERSIAQSTTIRADRVEKPPRRKST
jgi:hypothetical protein